LKYHITARIKGIIGGRLPAYEIMLANTSAIATRNAMEEAKVPLALTFFLFLFSFPISPPCHVMLMID
jgi:hypothetical protein